MWNRRLWRLLLAAAAALVPACSQVRLPSWIVPGPPPTATSSPTRTATDSPGPTLTPWPALPTLSEGALGDDDPAAALLPAFAADADLARDLTRYAVDVRVEFESDSLRATLTGQARIIYVVPSGETLSDLVLMLWPNDPQYFATMRAGEALINGVRVVGRPELDGIALRFELAEPAEAGDALDVSLPFAVDAGGPIGGVVPKRFGITEGVLAAPTFYPLVPRRIDGAWQVEAAPYGGDTTNSDVATYRVDVTYPEGLTLAASGVEIETTTNDDGTRTARYLTGPMRDFAFTLGPHEVDERTVDGVVVRALSLPDHAEGAEVMLESAARQLEILNDLVGPYPYPELDVVDVPGAFGGIEYPGIVFVGTLGTDWVIEPTVHEVAHQWFYALIGGDQLHEPWLDEALATYAEVLYYEAIGRPGAATGLLSQFRAWLRTHPEPETPIGRSVAAYGDPEAYALFVYGKGALFLDALRGEIGDEAFEAFLHGYYQSQRYGFATGEEFQQHAEAACGCDLDELFDRWVWEGGQVPGV